MVRLLRAPTVKLLAAIRHLFDWLVTGEVVPFNPASSVRAYLKNGGTLENAAAMAKHSSTTRLYNRRSD